MIENRFQNEEENYMKNYRVEKAIADIAYKTSVKNINRSCVWFFNQPKVPAKLEELKNTNAK